MILKEEIQKVATTKKLGIDIVEKDYCQRNFHCHIFIPIVIQSTKSSSSGVADFLGAYLSIELKQEL